MVGLSHSNSAGSLARCEEPREQRDRRRQSLDRRPSGSVAGSAGPGSDVHVYAVERNLSSPTALRSTQHSPAVSRQPSGHFLVASELLTQTRHLACANMPARNTVNIQVTAKVGDQIAPPAWILALASWETSLARPPAGWAFRPADFQPVMATADPGGEGIRLCPPAPWFATVWFPMRNGPPCLAHHDQSSRRSLTPGAHAKIF